MLRTLFSAAKTTGAEDSKQADTMGAISASFLIGGLEFGTRPTNLFDGLVDEVQLYDHALNSCQLQYLFDNPGETVPADCDGDGFDDDADNCPGALKNTG